MKKILFIIFICLLFTNGIYAQVVVENLDKLYEQWQEQFMSGSEEAFFILTGNDRKNENIQKALKGDKKAFDEISLELRLKLPDSQAFLTFWFFARKGIPSAYTMMALMYEDKGKIEESVDFYKKAMELGDEDAMTHLLSYYKSNDDEIELTKICDFVEEKYKSKALEGDLEAMHRMLHLYANYRQNGRIVAKLWADDILKKANLKSDKLEIGGTIAYMIRSGVINSASDIKKYLDKYINLETIEIMRKIDPDGLVVLGDLADAYMILEDYRMARDLYEIASERVLSLSGMRALGNIYSQGLGGVLKNTNAAIRCYLKAIEEYDDGDSMIKLGDIYYDCDNFTEAVKWYTKATENEECDNSYAYYSLGWCYEHGYGVRKNLSTALKYYQKAVDGGNEASIERIALIKPLLQNQKTTIQRSHTTSTNRTIRPRTNSR